LRAATCDGSDFGYGHIHGYARLVLFVLVLLWAGLEMLVLQPRTLAERSVWRQRMCRLIARAMGLRIDVIGRVPVAGMIVSNHVSYLDAVVLGALIPGVFVAKAEVRQWPLAGWLTARGGTIYLKRESARAVTEVNRNLSAAMADGLPVVIFPEGTTTGAADPLPFHPALFEPAVGRNAAVWPVALAYTVDGSNERVADEVCYWGSMTFLPHLVRLMRLRNLHATVCIADEPVVATTRHELAISSREVVVAMLHDGLVKPLQVPAVRRVDHHEAATAQPLQN
jgi:1-acyl-sn-glycerol-3-phosphate acyltransferase